MPKFPKAFARRKSSANALEGGQSTPLEQPSFKVFERPDSASKSFDGGAKFTKATGAPLIRPKTSYKEENMFDDLKPNRGSAASNTNTASTTDDSSRLSATSTAPSSTDLPGGSPLNKPYNDIPLPPIPKSNSGFSLRHAGRSLSWSRSKPPTPSPPKEPSREPSPPEDEESTSGRSRAMTTSSYASTATPPKLAERDLGLSLGGDFSDMFSGFGKRKSAILAAENARAASQTPVSKHKYLEPAAPLLTQQQEILQSGPSTQSRSNRLQPPSPVNIDRSVDIEPPQKSWNSNDGLMGNSSPQLPTQDNEEFPPPVPRHDPTTGTSPAAGRQQRPLGLRRNSGPNGRRQSTYLDDDAKLLQESFNASRRLNEPSYGLKVRDSWALPNTPHLDTAVATSGKASSIVTTPRAYKASPRSPDDNMFDHSIAASADVALRFEEIATSAPPRNAAPQNKVMTPAQFERYRQDQERLRSVGGQSKDDDEEEDEEPYDDEEDNAERNKQLAKQRRKQEAHMAVYRQQMMKVTGEGQSSVSPMRPTPFTSMSTPNLSVSPQQDDGEEEDEEVPLAILQAHGFPNKNKPPTPRLANKSSSASLRAAAQSAPPGGDGRLPVFARNLPQDPYYGAGLVNPSHRESLAFGSGAGSVQGGGPQRSLPPGGLVGVIATEERSRAMRRGSPNPQGEYPAFPAAPPNGFNSMGMPPNGMMNGVGSMSPISPMMLTPGDQAQIQMSQQMQQFMQMQMQFMQMMTSGQGPNPQNGQMSQPGVGEIPGPNSQLNMRPGSSQQQRAMTMHEANKSWLGSFNTPSIHGQGGYAPSIAPSERSNIGLPGRYRPVSQALPVDKSRASSMSGALTGWENKNRTPTVKAVRNSGTASDEDDEEGWEEMRKKKEKKKSLWRMKKDPNGLKEILSYTQ
ncbi:hypothetical protein B7494_g2820 [Chlorociboria aeruginascens]|nr:hypothetical protein B7494_g2820 [Chlorociboria aeruginascens]